MAKLDIITDLARAFLKKRDKDGFINQYLIDANVKQDDENYERVLRNANATWATITSEQKADAYTSSLYNPSPVGSGGIISKVMAAQYAPTTAQLPEFGTIERTAGALKSLFALLKGDFKEGFKAIGSILGEEILLYTSQTNKLFQEINQKVMMSGELAEGFRDEIMYASIYATKLGIGFDEMAEMVGDITTESGKFKLLNEDTMKEMALASKFTKDMSTFVKMGRNFELIGLGVRDMSLLVEKMAMKSLALGLNGKTITSMVNDNLKMINQYGFKGGVEGLSRMAQKSVEFRMNMTEVFKMADKVWEPDKALELVANLQVIGGAFGALNDPLKLMYMATNDMEGLQDAIIGAAQSLVTFNDEQGRFEITGANLRRAKAMAEELGIGIEELTNGAVAGAERMQAALDLGGLLTPLDDKETEFLTNLARMDGGQMIIDIPKSLRDDLNMLPEQTSIALSELTDGNIKSLLAQKELFEEMKPEDAVRRQVMALENVQRDTSALRGYMRVIVGQNAADIIDQAFGINGEFVSNLSEAMSGLGMKSFEGLDKWVRGKVQEMPELTNVAEGVGQDLIDGINSLTNKVEGKTGTSQKGELTTGEENKKVQQLENALKTERETKSTPELKTVTHNVNVNFNPLDATMDRIAKVFWGDPRLAEDYAKSYINPNSN